MLLSRALISKACPDSRSTDGRIAAYKPSKAFKRCPAQMQSIGTFDLLCFYQQHARILLEYVDLPFIPSQSPLSDVSLVQVCIASMNHLNFIGPSNARVSAESYKDIEVQYWRRITLAQRCESGSAHVMMPLENC